MRRPSDPGNLPRAGKPPFLERGNNSVGTVGDGGGGEEVLGAQKDAVGGLIQACAIGLFSEILIEGIVGNNLTYSEGCSMMDTLLLGVVITSPLYAREGEENIEGRLAAGMIDCDRAVDGQLNPRRRLIVLAGWDKWYARRWERDSCGGG